MDRAYFLYGLRLLADGEIPGLSPREYEPPYDVRVWLNKTPDGLKHRGRARWYQSPDLNQHGRPNLMIWRMAQAQGLHFVYDDGTEFLISEDGSQVWSWWSPAVTVADAAVYLRGPILAMILRLRGVVCLHASAVAVGGVFAIAILGSSGAGKSTTAAAFAQLGNAVLADDVTALNQHSGRFHVLPGYPWLNLWPDSAESLFGEQGSLPRSTPADGVNHWWDKRYLDLEASDRFHVATLPLAGVYVLGERTAGEGALRIEPLSAREAFMALTTETCVNYALDESMRVLEFKTLAQLVATVPVRLATPHSDPARLPELCANILRDCAATQGSPMTRASESKG
jgi:hypothetical protein